MFLNKLGIIQIKVLNLQRKRKQKRMKSIKEKAEEYGKANLNAWGRVSAERVEGFESMDIIISKNCKDRILYHLSEEFGIDVSWKDISSIEILNDSFHVFVKGHGEYLLFYRKF